MSVRKNTATFNEMRDMLLDGMTYQAIGNKCGVSRQRVEQILSPPEHIMTRVRKRAQRRCESCGVLIQRGAHLHHNNSDKIEPARYNDIDNILYLCCSCHRRKHHLAKPSITVVMTKRLHCQRCPHSWIPRKAEVRICPKCKSAYWDRPKTEKKGKIEGGIIK